MIKRLGESLSSRSNNFDLLRFAAAVAVIYSHSFDLTNHYNQEPLRVFSGGRHSIGELAVSASRSIFMLVFCGFTPGSYL